MNEKTEWYAWKHDILITLILILCAFWGWPWISKGKIDCWLLGPIYVVILVYIQCLFLCRKNFWTWTIVGIYGLTIACVACGAFQQNGIKNINGISLYALYLSIFISLVSLPMAKFILKSEEKISYLLLWPIGWFAGIIFSDLLNIDDGEFIGFKMSVYLALISVVIIVMLIQLDHKTVSIKKHSLLKWLSIISWLPAGLIPGYIILDGRFTLFATLLPIIAIYNYFRLSKEELIECQNR